MIAQSIESLDPNELFHNFEKYCKVSLSTEPIPPVPYTLRLNLRSQFDRVRNDKLNVYRVSMEYLKDSKEGPLQVDKENQHPNLPEQSHDRLVNHSRQLLRRREQMRHLLSKQEHSGTNLASNQSLDKYVSSGSIASSKPSLLDRYQSTKNQTSAQQNNLSLFKKSSSNRDNSLSRSREVLKVGNHKLTQQESKPDLLKTQARIHKCIDSAASFLKNRGKRLDSGERARQEKVVVSQFCVEDGPAPDANDRSIRRKPAETSQTELSRSRKYDKSVSNINSSYLLEMRAKGRLADQKESRTSQSRGKEGHKSILDRIFNPREHKLMDHVGVDSSVSHSRLSSKLLKSSQSKKEKAVGWLRDERRQKYINMNNIYNDYRKKLEEGLMEFSRLGGECSYLEQSRGGPREARDRRSKEDSLLSKISGKLRQQREGFQEEKKSRIGLARGNVDKIGSRGLTASRLKETASCAYIPAKFNR